MSENTSVRKSRVGIVASNKMDKTITVSVQRRIKHPIYGKFMKKTKNSSPMIPKMSATRGIRSVLKKVVHLAEKRDGD